MNKIGAFLLGQNWGAPKNLSSWGGKEGFQVEIQKNEKIVPRHCHKEAAYQISLSYDKYFLSYEGSKFSGEEAEEEAAAEALSRSEIDDFVKVIKTEPRRISACGFQHRVP